MMNSKLKITIVGPGRVGMHIGSLLSQADWSIQSIIGRNHESFTYVEQVFQGNVILETFGSAREPRDVILLTVRDDAIFDVCEQLVRQEIIDSNSVVIHTSGVSNSEALKAAADCKASVASFHPLQTFPSRQGPFSSLKGTYWFFEGGQRASVVAQNICLTLDGNFQEISTAQKSAYHLCATLACNSMNAILDGALQCSDLAGIQREEMQRALGPLMQTNLQKMLSASPITTLTGPVSRGDVDTVRSHLDVLLCLDEVRNLYAPICKYLATMAQIDGRIDAQSAHTIRHLFSDADSSNENNILENQ